MSEVNPPERQANQPFKPTTIKLHIQYLLYAQFYDMELDSPQRVLAQIKSPRPGRFVKVDVVQPTFKSFKSNIFNHLHLINRKCPLGQIAQHADNEGALHWYYSIQEPSGGPSK
jgi:hypothetical protein